MITKTRLDHMTLREMMIDAEALAAAIRSEMMETLEIKPGTIYRVGTSDPLLLIAAVRLAYRRQTYEDPQSWPETPELAITGFHITKKNILHRHRNKHRSRHRAPSSTFNIVGMAGEGLFTDVPVLSINDTIY